MKRFFALMRWVIFGGVLLVAAALVALAFYTRTDGFRRLFGEQALATINGSIRGTVSWERLDGSLWQGLRIHNLEVRHHDRVIFKTARAEVYYALLPLLWKQVQLTRLAATNPFLDLRKQAGGEWNLVEALSSGKPSSEPFNWTIEINGIEFIAGELTLRPVAGMGDLYWLRKLDIAGSLRMADGLTIDLDRLASWVDTPQTPQIYVNGGLNYRQAGNSQTLQLESLWLQSRLSRVRLSGAIKNFSDFDNDLELTIRHLAAADLTRYLAQWPAGVDVTGELTTRGPANALAGKFNVQLARGQIAGTIRADLLSQAWPYGADIAIRGLALEPILGNRQIAGVLSANLKVAGAGTAIDALNGSGDARVQSLSVAARDFGVVSLQAALRGRAADVNGAIDGPLAQGNWRSQLSFAAVPQYRADLQLRGVNIARLLQLEDSPNGKLSFSGKVSGTGFDPATMNSQVAIELLPSHWDRVNVEQGKILGQIANGKITIDELRLRAGSALLSARGELGVAAPQSGQINYQLQVADLGPWLSLIGRQGSGRLDFQGQAAGNLARLQTRGSLQSHALQLVEGSAAAARADFVLERRAGAALPSGTINLTAQGVRAGVELAQLRAAVTLPIAPEPAIGVRADARDGAGREHRLVAEIENPQGDFVLRARELSLALGDGVWRLAAPATIARRGDGFLVDRISLRSGRAQVAAEGRFALQGQQALTVRASDIPLAALRALLPQGADPTSAFSGELQVRGSAAQPELEAVVQLSGGQIAGQNYQGMQARADYRRQRAELNLTIDQDSSHNLQVRGTIPLALAWAPSWRAEPLPGMDLRARSAGLSLAFLNALKLPVENIIGQVALDLAITGSLSEPQPQGTFALSEGGFRVNDLGVRVTGVNITGSADGSRLSITRLGARSGSGTLEGSGVIALKRFLPQEVNFSLAARRWPAIETEGYSAVVNADLRATGPITAPAISGKAQVVEGSVRPALGFLDRSPVSLKRDPTIVVVTARGGKPIAAPGMEKGADAEQPNIWRDLALNVAVAIPNNFWIRHPNASIELSGNLGVDKKPNSEPALKGTIETVRGWVGFQGRRFEIRRGLMQFTGAQPINPTIEVVGEHRVNNYLVSAVASGTASKPALTLTSQPQLEQSDVLALLLFGKPTAELTGNQQLSLQQNAIDITAGFAAAQLGRAVSDALGLESLGLDLSEVSFSGGQARFGRYVGEKTYVSASQEISGKHGREFAVEYQLTPQLRIDATTNSSGNSGVDIVWRKRY